MTTAYLLVYQAAGAGSAQALRDTGNDPDFRSTPYSWGICRRDVRRSRERGDRLFFVAFVPSAKSLEERYWLTSYLEVEDVLDQGDAAFRFAGRENVILDPVDPAQGPEAAAAEYVARNRHQLGWADSKSVLQAIDQDVFDPWQILEGRGEQLFAHSWWDSHADWRRRATAPYVVGSPASAEIGSAIPYTHVVEMIPGLLPADQLRVQVGFLPMHVKRRVDDHAEALAKLFT